MSSKITVLHGDGIDALDDVSAFAYCDPPYVQAGPSLYDCFFGTVDHQRLAGKLLGRRDWLLSYDDHANVSCLYDGKCDKQFIDVSGAAPLGGSNKKREVMFCPRGQNVEFS